MNALRCTHSHYSSGTRVEVLNYTKANTVFVSVLATKEVLEIPVDELVFLRDKTNVANTPNAREKRRAKKAATTNGTD